MKSLLDIYRTRRYKKSGRDKCINRLMYEILVEMTIYHIEELKNIHGIDMSGVLGENFMKSLKRREVLPERLAGVHSVIIRPMLDDKRRVYNKQPVGM